MPFPSQTGYGQIQPSPAPSVGAGQPATIPAANVPGFGDGPGGGFNDNWGDLAWMPSPEESRLRNDIDTAKMFLGLAVRGIGLNLAYRGLKYSWDNAWDPIFQALNPLTPFGAHGLRGWHLDGACLFTPCGAPWKTGFAYTSFGCGSLCSIPTVTMGTSAIDSTGQAGPALPQGFTAVRGSSNPRLVMLSHRNASPGIEYVRIKQSFVRNVGVPSGQPTSWSRNKPNPGLLPEPMPVPGRFYQPAATPVPNIDPWLQPVGDPFLRPAALPYYVVRPGFNPASDPAFQPRKWERSRPREKPVEAPYSPAPGIEVFPGTQPGPSIVITPVASSNPFRDAFAKPNAKGRSQRRASGKGQIAHRYQKPGKGVRERKPKDTKLYKAAKALMNAVTESGDVIDAAWGALDAYHTKGGMNGAGGWQTRVKGQKTSYPQKLKDIYNAFGDPRFDEGAFARDFAIGLAKNEVGDRVGGAIGKQTRAANRRGAGRKGINLGVAAGPAL